MADRLLRRLPPLTNDWLLGLASATPFDDASAPGPDADPPLDDAQMELAVSVVESVNSGYFRFDVEGAVGPDEPRHVVLGPQSDSRGAGLGLTADATDRKLLALVVLAAPPQDGARRLRVAGTDKALDATAGLVVVVPAFTVVEAPDGDVAVAAFHAFGPAFR